MSSRFQNRTHDISFKKNMMKMCSVHFIEYFSFIWFLFQISLGFGALAALKRKRKKFSKSRNTSPVLEPSAPSKTESSPSKKVKPFH